MNKLKTWLLQANGWRRLWLVASVLFVIYSTLVWPINSSEEFYLANYEQLFEPKKEIGAGELKAKTYMESWGEIQREKLRNHLIERTLTGLFGSILISIFFYGLGHVGAWVIAGFKKEAD